MFELRPLVEVLSWLKRAPVDRSPPGTRATAAGTRSSSGRNADGTFLGFDRVYEGLDARHARVGLTSDPEVARMWQESARSVEGWRRLRRAVPLEDREARRVPGRVFEGTRPDQVMDHLECLQTVWGRPDSTIARTSRTRAGAWADREAQVDAAAALAGPVWVGAGRRLAADDIVVGPAILWDTPGSEAASDGVPWDDLEPVDLPAGFRPATGIRSPGPVGKRAFDIVFAALVLAITLPFYPLIALAILIEDGWPIFFAHRRETLGGRQFPCWKFRSMRRNAETIKREIEAQNVSDGPQFFVKNDPRTTRVGAFLRKTQLDEFPQFINVLLGHMSVVGPRPSPRRENQCCPPWREARLSVRPGVTGLWQVMRTRRKGLDFQEWIRYDIEYVENMSWRTDLWIIAKTTGIVLKKMIGR